MKRSKILLLITAFTFVCLNAFSQSVDYNTIILPENIKNVDIREKLVQLAWNNNPENRIVENNIKIAKKSIGVNASEWLDIFRANGNINEFTIDPGSSPNPNNYYPRYNFSASFSLGMFLSIPTRTKIAKIDLENQIELQNSQKLKIRAQVLRLYEAYRRNKELFKIQTNLTDEAYSSYVISEQQFKSGEITLEEWTVQFKNYNSSVEQKITRESELEIAKINLEEVIGVNIDDILNTYQD